MRWAAFALTVCGCNQIFDLNQTRLVDAAPDVAIDAPRVCPPIGTPLRLGRELQQVVRQDCTGYTVSRVSGQAAAVCLETMPQYSYFPYEGAIDSELSKLDLGLTWVDTVRLFPEGDRLFVRGSTAAGQSASLYARGPDNLWAPTKEELPANIMNYQLGTFTTGPDRRLVMTTGSGVDEHAQRSDGAWTLVQSYSGADWACDVVYGVTLSPDGLRMLVTCYRSATSKIDTRYAERTSRAEAFGPLQVFDGVPQGVYWIDINDDCSRVYFSALQSVFAAELD